MESRTRRQQLDHERYMANREERCAKQRAYYQENKERVTASIRDCERRRIERLKHQYKQ